MVLKNDKSSPRVRTEGLNFKYVLMDWLGIKDNLDNNLGLAFLRFDFKSDDDILLCNYNEQDYTFDCIVNGDYFCSMKFNNLYSKEYNTEIVLYTLSTEVGYECIPSNVSEIGMKISYSWYSVGDIDTIKFTRVFSSDRAKYIVQVKENILELEVCKPDDIQLPLYDENGKYSKYKVENEDELIHYLYSSVFSMSIDEIYKKLCELSLGDVSKYPIMTLKKSIVQDDGQLKITDLIELRNGELEKFGMTNTGMTVFVDKEDNWLFEMPSENSLPVSFYISSQNGKMTYMFSSDEDYDFKYYMNNLIQTDKEIAEQEVLNVKRRIRTLFNNRGSN